MLTLRCTARTLKRFRLTAVEDPPDSTGRLGDLYANVLRLGRRQLVLCVAERTFLPVLLPARRERFPAKLGEDLLTMLSLLEIVDEPAVAELEAAAEVTIARTASRSVLGVMNDMALALETAHTYGGLPEDRFAISLWLSGRIHAPLDHGSPAEATRRLFGLEGRGPVPGLRPESAEALAPGAGPALQLLQTRTALHLTLTIEDTEPAIRRGLWVDERTSLRDLHRVFQVALGWSDRHLYEFVIGDVRYGDPDAEVPTRDARRTRLADLDLPEGAVFHYTYDFGDDWRCAIRVGDRSVIDRDADLPRLAAGERAGPPEDCGGADGLAELLAALADPAHPEHDAIRDWVGADYDPARFDRRAADAFLGLAARWRGIRATEPAD